MFENAKWIGEKFNTYNENSILFRKEFKVTKEVESAKIYICGLGYEECTLNGKRVTDEVLTTPVTSYDKRVLYSEYDAEEFIFEGINVLGVEIGNGWYNDIAYAWEYTNAAWRDVPKLIAQLDIKYSDGSRESIVSDTSWKSHGGAIVFNHSRQGEIYDARLEQTGWNKPGFDDSEWERVIIMRAAGLLYPKRHPPIRVIRRIKPVSKNKDIYDFGENLSGWAHISVTGEAGREIRLTYDERLNPDGSLCGKVNNAYHTDKKKLFHEDRYILKGAEREEYSPKFCYHGFRYVKAENAPEDFEIIAEVVHTDLKKQSDFKCSDNMLNLIHEACVHSTLTIYHGIPTDCPHREQNGWTGDAQLSAEQSLINFDMTECYRKWMYDFKDAQRPSGQLPGMIPTTVEEWYNNCNGPAWDSAIILIPWYVYKYTHDKSLIIEMWENMQRYMGYMLRMTEDYTVEFGYGYWCTPPGTKKCPVRVTDTAYFYQNAVLMKKCAELTGHDSDFYEKLAENIKKAWRKKFLYNEELWNCQTYFACAIYYGLVNDDETGRYAKRLAELIAENDYHIDCGILGNKCIYNALCENGYLETAYKMVTNPTMPSYAYWINNGMTTLCETWEMKNSCNHHMFSEVDNWLYRYIAGICVEDDGIIIRPQYLSEIEWAEADFRDLYIRRDGKRIKLKTPFSVKVVLNGETKAVGAGEYEFTL